MKRSCKFFALTILAAFCAAWFLLGRSENARTDVSSSSAINVRLANRMVEFSGLPEAAFPEAPLSAGSVRGSAPFVLAVPKRVTGKARERAEACGAKVLGVAAPYGIIAEADAAALRRLRTDETFSGAAELLPEDKIAGSLAGDFAAKSGVRLPVNVLTVRPEDANVVAAALVRRGVAPDEVRNSGRGRVRTLADAKLAGELAARGDVRWIERRYPARLMNDVAVGPALMNVNVVRDTHGLTGRGQTVTVSDTGLDTGNASTVMADFSGRIAGIDTVSGCFTSDIQGHGTHVAGSICGSGELSGENRPLKGVAPEAKLNVWQCLKSDGYLYFPSAWGMLFQPNRLIRPSYIHSGSWGMSATSEYTSNCVEVDEWFWEHPENLGVFAAGNTGNVRSIADPGGAKNTLCVGAVENLRPGKSVYADNQSEMAYFSSKGPMRDGRIKPDICAPGSYILSTFSSAARAKGKVNLGWTTYVANENYTYNGGTSMATPLVAGSAALVRQWLVERRGYANPMPTAALMKAVITGGAHDMAADAGANCGGAAPNGSQGWGRIDLGETLYPSNRQVKLVDRIPFDDGTSHCVRVTLTNTAPFEVQLAWTDYPGIENAAQALVNDLDLVVSNEFTGAVWNGNGVSGGDRVNNVESVRIAAADPGVYSISVNGAYVYAGSRMGGAAALYVRGAFPESEVSETSQKVVLSVRAGEGEKGEMYPGAGVYQVTKGVPIRLEALDYFAPSNEFGTVSAKRPVVGWYGTGDVPASGVGGSVVVTLERDSEIVWRWADKRDLLLRTYLLIASYGAYYWLSDEYWLQEGSRMDFFVPSSVPGGTDSVDLSFAGLDYVDDDGSVKRMRRQRLGRIEVAETDSVEGEAVTDASGYMSERFSLTVDKPMDVLFKFWDEASTNVSSALPTWWYYRYVADNPSADDIRFTAVSPQALEWIGGAGRTRILERCGELGVNADWREVYVCRPQAVLTNRWQVPPEYSTNSFYRIRAE